MLKKIIFINLLCIFLSGNLWAAGYQLVQGGTFTAINSTAANFKGQMEIIAPLTPDTTRIRTDDYVGYVVSNTDIVGATTSATLIPGQTSQKIQIKSVLCYNHSTSAGGTIELKWSGGTTIVKCYCDLKQSLGWDCPDLSPVSEGLQVTTTGGNIFIKIIYRQSINQ